MVLVSPVSGGLRSFTNMRAFDHYPFRPIWFPVMSIQTAPTMVICRAYRLTVDPAPQQTQTLSQRAGTARFAYNNMTAVKQQSHKLRLQAVALAMYGSEALGEKQTDESDLGPMLLANYCILACTRPTSLRFS